MRLVRGATNSVSASGQRRQRRHRHDVAPVERPPQIARQTTPPSDQHGDTQLRATRTARPSAARAGSARRARSQNARPATAIAHAATSATQAVRASCARHRRHECVVPRHRCGRLRALDADSGPIASASAPDRRNTSSASAGEHTSGSPWMLKLVFSTAPTPQRSPRLRSSARERAAFVVGDDLRTAGAVDAGHAGQHGRDARRAPRRPSSWRDCGCPSSRRAAAALRSRACWDRTAGTRRAA